MRRITSCLLLCFLAWGAGCASVPRDPRAAAQFRANHDPLEPLNRRIFAANLSLDRHLIKPVAQGYRDLLPAVIRDALRRVLANLNEPIIIGNCLLQGRLKSAGTSAGRFVLNSTVGFAGLDDVATKVRLRPQVADFGQTLWAWKFPEGPYLVLPLFGPSSPRDGIGAGVDAYFDPWRYVARNNDIPNGYSTARTVANGIDRRAEAIGPLDEIQKESIDYYASFRSLYRQNRAAELAGGSAVTPLPAADFYDDPGH